MPDEFISPYDEMQKAVDIVNSSTHPTNKIAATLAGIDQNGRPYSISMTNYWPDRIHACFGADARIGNSSGTIHAETACLLTAPRSEGASLFITDPFCPNCAKNMAEAGIRTIYIDHKGFTKDFAGRRGDAFDSMSMRICEKAGIGVYEIHRREQRLNSILEIPRGFVPRAERPVQIEPAEPGLQRQYFEEFIKRPQADSKRFAVAMAHDASGVVSELTAFAHAAIGYSFDRDYEEMEQASGKYSFILEPVNRLLMNASRHGLKLIDGEIYVSQAPTSREQVNLVGAGITGLRIGDRAVARDPESLQGLGMLEKAGILKVL